MKKGIHPEYKEMMISCVCGEVFHTRSTKESIRVEICSKCHPFFTGQDKIVDSAGMVEKYRKRVAAQQSKGKSKKAKTQESEQVEVGETA